MESVGAGNTLVTTIPALRVLGASNIRHVWTPDLPAPCDGWRWVLVGVAVLAQTAGGLYIWDTEDESGKPIITQGTIVSGITVAAPEQRVWVPMSRDNKQIRKLAYLYENTAAPPNYSYCRFRFEQHKEGADHD